MYLQLTPGNATGKSLAVNIVSKLLCVGSGRMGNVVKKNWLATGDDVTDY